MRTRLGLTFLVLLLSPLGPPRAQAQAPTPAEEKPAARDAASPNRSERGAVKAEAKASPNVTSAPSARDFVVIPLRVHLLTSKKNPELHCLLTEEDVRRIVGKANRIWSVAGIHFGIESILREPVAREERFTLVRDQERDIPLGLYRILAPDASREFAGQHVYYIHKFSVNGVFLGGKISFVQDTAKLRPVPGGIDEPLPRVTAHELGHALSLSHRQNVTNLLASGTTGTLLNEAEVAAVRAAAGKMPGAMSHEQLESALETAKTKGETETAERLKAWLKAVEDLAKKP